MKKQKKEGKITIHIEEQDGILQRREYDVDPTLVLIDGILLSEYIREYKRAQSRTSVIN
jgi:hypothetical protein